MAFALPVDAPTDSERTPAPSTADAARPDPVGLSWMRRWSWWSIVGLPVVLGPVAAVEIALARPPAAVGVVAVGSALCAAVATGRLVAQRFARTDQERLGDGTVVPRRLVVAATVSAAALIASVQLVEPALFDNGEAGLSVGLVGAAVGAVAAVWYERRRLIVVGGALVATALAAATGLAAGELDVRWVIADGVVIAVVGAGLLLGLHYWNVMAGLDRARRVEGELAVANERLRFAADLHDIQGHHLQVIALKSELAQRLGEADPSAAAGHMGEVGEHARTALADTRAVVQSYRHTSLATELANATRVLAAAGIDARIEGDAHRLAEGLAGPARELLGLVVREATTNVVRHSRAAHARIALDVDERHARLRLRNDGATASSATSASSDDDTGTGLRALADRLEAAGGVLHWQRNGADFVLTAQMPVVRHATGSSRPQAQNWPTVDLDRIRRATWWSSVGLAYALGAVVVVGVVTTLPAGPVAAVAVAGAVCGSLASARLIARRLAALDPGASHDASRPTVVLVLGMTGAAALVVAAQLVDLVTADAPGPATSGVVVGVVAGAVAVTVATRRRWLVVAALAVATTALAALVRAVAVGEPHPNAGFDGVVVLAIGMTVIGQVAYWDLMLRLDRARRVEGELAVANERLRFAADLHDIQGHHLQVIALKSELAQRLGEADPSTAAGHMGEVGAHARTALADTRAVVQGYRHTSLAAELANATRVLAAAGIDARIDGDAHRLAEGLAGPARELLGLVVREATTNVVRHSRAAHARIAVEVDERDARLRLRNDGATPTSASSDDDAGTGLRALADRAERVGGAVRWGSQGGWFSVTATVPVGEDPPDDPASHPAAAGRR